MGDHLCLWKQTENYFTDSSMSDNKGPKKKEAQLPIVVFFLFVFLFFSVPPWVLSAITKTHSSLWEGTQHGRLLV